METTNGKIFSKNFASTYDGKQLENITDYVLNVPNEEPIHFNVNFTYWDNGKKFLDIETNNINKLNELTDCDMDPVEFRNNHNQLDIEEVIDFKDDLVDAFMDIVQSDEFKDFLNESGFKFDNEDVMKVLSGEVTHYRIETNDIDDFIENKTWNKVVENQGEETIQSCKDGKIVFEESNEIELDN